MRDISRRIEKVEKILNLNREPIVIDVIDYYGEDNVDLPPDHTEGNITVQHVRYDNGVLYER
jgi:hypothetical protein